MSQFRKSYIRFYLNKVLCWIFSWGAGCSDDSCRRNFGGSSVTRREPDAGQQGEEIKIFIFTLVYLSLLPLIKFPDLMAGLLLAEQKIGRSLRWRLHEKLLQRYSCLARLLPGELLHQSFSPRIFIILTTNVSTATCHTTSQHATYNIP